MARKTCKFCRKPKKVPKNRLKGVPISEYENDDYCSRPCCEADLGFSGAADITNRKVAA